MKTDFMTAINQVSTEKGVSKEVVIEAIEAALVSAYKRYFNGGANQDVIVRIDRKSGDVGVFMTKQVVETVTDARTEIGFDEASAITPDARVGDTVEVNTTPQDFGRIAAQTAKQVVLQRLREAERELIYEAYTEREG